MRRKLFCIALFLMAGIAFTHCFGIKTGLLAAGAMVLIFCLKNTDRDYLWQDLIVFAGAFLAGCLLLTLTQMSIQEGTLHRYLGNTAEINAVITQIERVEEDKYKIRCDVQGEQLLCTYYQPLEEYWNLIGASIQFSAEVNMPKPAGNPRTFDYSLYLKSEGIHYTAEIKHFTVCSQKVSCIDKIKRRILGSREKMLEKIRISPQVNGLIRGILFGDTNELDDKVYEEFRQNGTAHVLAVSGLHVGILYGVYKALSKKHKHPGITILFVFLLFIYGTATLWAVSVTRAVALILFMLFGDLLDRRYDLLTALAAVALFIMFRNPYAIFGAGFQMSFLAVLSMAFFIPVLSEWIGETAAVLLSVQLGLIPYMAYTFNYISFHAILCNIPVVFFISLLVPAGLFGYLLYLFSGIILPFFPQLLNGLGYVTIKINSIFHADGFLSFDVVSPPLWLLAMVYFLLFFCSSEYFRILWIRRKPQALILPLLLFAAVTAGAWQLWASPFDRAEIVFIDVGQGDCVHLKSEDGENILIDGGGNKNYNVGEKVLKPYLLKNGVSHVDLAAATHLHADHYLGLEQLAECFPVKKTVTAGRGGQRIVLNEEQWIDILWPPDENGDTEDENLNSMIFKIHNRGLTALITGDITEEGEKLLLQRYKGTGILQADVLKVAHHGSPYSTCDAFLEEVNPKVAVISVGKNNYGHPSNMLIEKMQKKGIMVFRTDRNGAVGMINQRGKITACTKNQ